jgi:hypothetical protein
MAKETTKTQGVQPQLTPQAMTNAAAMAGAHVASMAEFLGINTRQGRFALLRCILGTVDGATILTAISTGDWMKILGGVKWAEVLNCVQKSFDDDGSFSTTLPGEFIGEDGSK